jgi:putative ABC transport system permease protein
MNLFQLALRNLRRRPMRTSLAVLGVALAVGSAIALLGLSRSIEDSVRRGVDERGVDLAVTEKGSSDLFSGVLPQTLDARLRGIPGVAGVAGEFLTFAPTDDGRQILLSGWTRDSYFWARAPLLQGRLPAAGEHNVALIGDALSETLAKKTGDSVAVLGTSFRIIGVTKYSSTLNRGLLIVPLDDLQAATYRTGQVTGFNVSVAPGLTAPQLDTLKRRITALGGVYVSTTDEILRDSRNIKVLHAVSLATSEIALMMGVLNVLNTLLMAVQERTREMGVLAAVGWSRALIVRSIILEGLILCGLGSVTGVGIGYLASWFCTAIPVIGSVLSFTPTPGLVAVTVAGAFGLSLLGSLYPALRAVNMTPAAALQRA